jgi:molecular chaperone DnaK (HSP70)
MYLGIDFGSSNSVVAGIEGDNVKIFHASDGGEVLPSVIYIDKRGHRLFGRRAYDQGLVNPENVASGFKRLLGSKTDIDIPGADIALSPEECSAEILRQLLAMVNTETGNAPIEGVVITIPAAFNQMQCEALLRAAQLAELPPVKLLQEPIAAALAVARQQTAPTNRKYIIYDLGGGTFDVALARLETNGTVDILAHQGISMLGGRDFDRMIVGKVIRPWLLEQFDLPEHFSRMPEYKRLLKIAQLTAEKAKIELSAMPDVTLFASEEDVRLTDASGHDIHIEIPFSRAAYEDLIKEPIDQTLAVVRQIMDENSVGATDIDRIIFVGGPSRTPLIRQKITDELGLQTDMHIDPLTAVAVGAAHFAKERFVVSAKPVLSADTLSKQEDHALATPPAEKMATTVAPIYTPPHVTRNNQQIPATQTIAIKVLDHPLAQENILMPIIEKGETLPKEGTVTFKSTCDLAYGDTGSIAFELFQVEYPGRLDLNLCIGFFRIGGDDLPVGYLLPKDATLDFHWAMDDNGILTARVSLPEQGGHRTELKAPRFYAPQAGHMSFAGEQGMKFAQTILKQTGDEWGDLASAMGPGAGRALDILQNRLEEQQEMLVDSLHDPEGIKRVTEEARFLRQDIAKLAKKHQAPVLQRKLGKLLAAYNRMARAHALAEENARFDNHATKLQDILDRGHEESYGDAELHMVEMRDLFFAAAWRDQRYVEGWFERLKDEDYLFPNHAEFMATIQDGDARRANGDQEGLKAVVHHLLQNRVLLAGNDMANELATITKSN